MCDCSLCCAEFSPHPAAILLLLMEVVMATMRTWLVSAGDPTNPDGAPAYPDDRGGGDPTEP